MSDDIPKWKAEAAADLTRRRDELLAARRKADEAAKLQLRQFDDALAEISTAARAMELPVSWLQKAVPTGNLSPATATLESVGLSASMTVHKPFRVRALELLSEAYPHPLKASKIQAKIEAEYQTKFHDKTAGMTLYRLSKEGFVRRKGVHWFFVPEDQRNKENPGSGDQPDDPGLL